MRLELEKKDKVVLLSSIVIVGFFIAVLFHYVLGVYAGLEYPANTFLFNPEIALGDFTDLVPKLKGFAPYAPPAWWQQYCPLAYLILTPFAYIPSKHLAYIIYMAIFFTFFVKKNIKEFACESFSKLQNFQNIFILSFLSYPVLAAADRGNFDLIVLIFFSWFIYSLKDKKYQTSAIVLGLINAMKPFCLIFLFLFLFEKKYREFFLSIMTSALFIIGGFLIFKGPFFEQINSFLESIVWFKQAYFVDYYGGMSNSSSLFMSLKSIFCLNMNIISTTRLIQIYGYINFFITVLTLFFTAREKVFWKKIALLSLYIIAVPSASFDYKLLYLFVPIWLFVNSEEKSKFDLAYTLLFGALIIPKRFFIFIWSLNYNSISSFSLFPFSVVFSPIIMLFFMMLIAIDQFSKEKKAADK